MTVVPAAAALFRVLLDSMAASVALAVIFSLTILGSIRASEMHRANRSNMAAAYATLALCGLIAFAASVVYGLLLVANKA
ncbi:MAG TPA: hypothetical protein VG223_18375 [Solirubrobacteraceae bacterium]|nr:hypothetical protein [Solirubrobacteraceae bacterium]